MDTNRAVTITDKNGVIEIRPQPSLEEVMKPYWDEFKRTHPNFKPLTDEELKQAIREAVAEGATRNEQ